MKPKRSSRKSSTRSSLDQRYEQLLDELQRSIRREWRGATSGDKSASLEHVYSFAESTDAILSALREVHNEQTRRIEKLEVLLYDLEGRQQQIEESIGEKHHAGESKFLTALTRWITDIDQEVARRL
jgi:hypothetical protein